MNSLGFRKELGLPLREAVNISRERQQVAYYHRSLTGPAVQVQSAMHEPGTLPLEQHREGRKGMVGVTRPPYDAQQLTTLPTTAG